MIREKGEAFLEAGDAPEGENSHRTIVSSERTSWASKILLNGVQKSVPYSGET